MDAAREHALRVRLVAIARASPRFMQALAHVRALRLRDACIGAGAVRNLVWDALHGHAGPSTLSDVDVAWFDPSDLSQERDRALQSQLHALAPATPWEVTNQAGVHLWFEAHFGHAVEPLRSLDEAVASWPEVATAVALSLRDDGSLRVIAPHGLADLFDMIVRRNPARVSLHTYRQRAASKRYTERWPRVRVIDPDIPAPCPGAPMTRLETVRIDAAAHGAPLTPQQKRFNTLTRQIAQARDKLAAWQEHSAPFALLHEQRMRPLLDELRAARRAWVLALHAASEQGRWTRAERDTFDELIGEAADMLLATRDDDPELRALFEKHAGVDYDTSRQEDLVDLKQMAEAMTGMDLGNDDVSAADLFRRLQQGMAEFEAEHEERRAAHAASRPRTAAQAKREDEAALATQSVRAIFRKLASALHPDRETDAEQRRIKTELMQRANQAYEKNDLLTLLQTPAADRAGGRRAHGQRQHRAAQALQQGAGGTVGGTQGRDGAARHELPDGFRAGSGQQHQHRSSWARCWIAG